MICKKPYMMGVMPFGCGQCLPCRINRKRVWSHRLLLELLKHGDASFITLTYNDENLPTGGTLVPRDLVLWLKKIRKKWPKPLRFFAVGEYGMGSERPHYHVILYGYPTCLKGRSSYTRRRKKCCEQCDRVQETWKLGNVFLGTVTVESASYVASYTTKGWTNPKHEGLRGRYKEFTRMSLRPGIGREAMKDIADALTNEIGQRMIIAQGDAPNALSHGRINKPLGRYLHGKLREDLKLDEKACKESRVRRYSAEMVEVFGELLADGSANSTLFRLHVQETEQQRRNQEKRWKIHQKGKKI